MKGPDNISVRDRYFVLGWSLEDTKKIERYTLALRTMYGKPEFAPLYTKLSDAMIDLVERKHNDHHSAFAELGHDWLKVEPINQPSFGDDMVTFQGLNKLLKIYLGTASGVFKWVARGTAAGTPTPYSTVLVTELGTRIDASVTGFHEVKGSSLRIFATYATTVTSGTIQQIGIFDAVTTGLMFAIHDFGGNGFPHTANADTFSLGAVVDFIPFGDV